MHFGCLAGSDDEACWPSELFNQAREELGVQSDWSAEDSFVQCDVGETLSSHSGKM